MMQSLVNDAAQSGWYPRWPAANDVTYVMGGDSPVDSAHRPLTRSAHGTSTSKRPSSTWSKPDAEPGIGPHNISERPFLADYLKKAMFHAEQGLTSTPRAPSNTPATTSPSPNSHGTSATNASTSPSSSNRKTGKILSTPITAGSARATATAHGSPDFDPERSLPKRYDAPGSTDQYGFEEGNTYQYTLHDSF